MFLQGTRTQIQVLKKWRFLGLVVAVPVAFDRLYSTVVNLGGVAEIVNQGRVISPRLGSMKQLCLNEYGFITHVYNWLSTEMWVILVKIVYQASFIDKIASYGKIRSELWHFDSQHNFQGPIVLSVHFWLEGVQEGWLFFSPSIWNSLCCLSVN